MGLIKLTSPIPDEFECEIIDTSLKDVNGINLVRPCERYLELFKSCKSIRGRLHQYYVYGERIDCQQYHNNYTACMDYRKTKDLDLLTPIVEWEENMIKTRLKTVEQNKAWEMRDKPPQDFSGPLPDFIARRPRNRLFEKVDKEQNR